MRFHCHRCKTRYSIADERVRGKILKIRCKGCAAVITVREGMSAPTDYMSGGDTVELGASTSQLEIRELEGALPELRSASEGWYVSRDGAEDGPMTAAQAAAWVARQPAGSQLFAWRDGFADWKPVAEVAELAPRPAPVAPVRTPSAPPMPRAPEAAASLARAGQSGRMAAAAPVRVAEAGVSAGRAGQSGRMPLVAPLHTPPPEPVRAPSPAAAAPQVARLSDDAFGSAGGGDELDLDISEPSRVVQLDVLMAQRAAGEASRRTGAQPALPGIGGARKPTGAFPVVGVGRSTGTMAALAGAPAPLVELTDTGVEALRPARRRSSMPLVVAVVAIMGAATAALAYVVLGDDGGAPSGGVAGHVPSDFESLGYQLDRPRGPETTATGAARAHGDDDKTDRGAATTSRTPRRGSDTGGRTSGDTGGRTSGDTGGRTSGDTAGGTQAGQSAATGAVAGDIGPVTPLSPDDVIQQSSRSQIGFQRCYERAKKKDPFLEVKSINIDLQVLASGEVTNVRLSSHDDTQLGECLKSRVAGWKFRPSTGGIATQIALRFER